MKNNISMANQSANWSSAWVVFFIYLRNFWFAIFVLLPFTTQMWHFPYLEKKKMQNIQAYYTVDCSVTP